MFLEEVTSLKNLRQRIVPTALAALFAATTATSMLASQAAHPAAAGAKPGLLADTAQVASAQGYGYYRPGYYHWQGRYWAHRRWHPAYWGRGHVWHAGVWVYF